MAPELHASDPRPTMQSDIYAFGMIIFRVRCRLSSLEASSSSPQCFAWNDQHPATHPNGEPLAITDFPEGSIPSQIWDIVRPCLAVDPAARPTFGAIVRGLESCARSWVRPNNLHVSCSCASTSPAPSRSSHLSHLRQALIDSPMFLTTRRLDHRPAPDSTFRDTYCTQEHPHPRRVEST